jgi:ABC-type sugar transport system ATPase subunit
MHDVSDAARTGTKFMKPGALVKGPATISCHGVSKVYGGTQALASVDLEIRYGTIHALVGENGAGKSTCLGVLAGRVRPDAGRVVVGGHDLSLGDPRASRDAGVTAIYQELTIVPALSTQANVFLAQEQTRLGLLDRRAMRSRFVELCESLDIRLPTDIPAGSLSVADQQLLEILRGLVRDPDVVLFDEPTSSLAAHERDVVFRIMRDLRDRGKAVIFVSHNLDEVLALSDHVTAFRNGRVADARPAADWSKRTLVAAMLGRSIEDHVPDATPAKGRATTGSLFEMTDVAVPGALDPVQLTLQPGEIVGIGGLVGSGRSTLLRAIAGVARGATGQLTIDGKPHPWPSSPRQAKRLGIGLITEDRKRSGLLLRMSAMDNACVNDWGRLSKFGMLSRRSVERRARSSLEDLAFDITRLHSPASALSGGNQQKLLIGRWRANRPKILLADEPTRGVDIGAKRDIMRALIDMASEGVALVVVSSELEEIVELCDRILVLSEGRPVGELRRGQSDFTVEAILQSAFRTHEEAK